jgi:hypothetical protein
MQCTPVQQQQQQQQQHHHQQDSFSLHTQLHSINHSHTFADALAQLTSNPHTALTPVGHVS